MDNNQLAIEMRNLKRRIDNLDRANPRQAIPNIFPGAVIIDYKLSIPTEIGATSVTINKIYPAVQAQQSWIVISPFTIKCEVRRILLINGSNYSVSALDYAHDVNDLILFTSNPDLYLMWFGAIWDNVADDTVALTRAVAQATKSNVNHRKIILPGGEGLITDNIYITAHGLCIFGARTRRPISSATETGASRINFEGTGPLFKLGSDNGNPYNDADYDGYKGFTLRDLSLKYTGTTDAALNNGKGNYRAGTYGIQDWKGGEVNLNNVWIEGFHYGFWGIQSDQNRWDNVMLRYNKTGAYLGPRSDQLNASHLGSLLNDTLLHLDRCEGHNYYGGYFVNDGSATDYPIKIGTQWSDKGCRGIKFNGCWFEHFGGYQEIEAFVSIGKGDTVESNDIFFHDSHILVNTLASGEQRSKYFVEVDKCDRIYIDGIGSISALNLDNLVSYVGNAANVIFHANKEYTDKIGYDDNSGGTATPVWSQNSTGLQQTVFDLWYQNNVAANQTAVQLARTDHVGSAPAAYINSLIPGRFGKVKYIYIKLNANWAAGTLTITLTINGVAQSMTATINSAVAFAISTNDEITFTGADRLGLTITTDGSWSPTTADLRAGIILEN